ncbi:NAD(P)/FAD-dependent oxidoreductase [Acuticoccus kandeliae]|uniref:NAD(P)/FAD-dependent oxidoreductase n=1 Tax=Acuticoccus kandeliae TaxID=2073160 RepID=UPI000D3EB22F|nr:FAD-dependent oxidoreductase [Acuticoccus kandeliae]
MPDLSSILHPDFAAEPYWWQSYRPQEGEAGDLPRETPVLIVGAGYTGLNAAIALADRGILATVIDADLPGAGASTRNGGGVSAGVNTGKTFTGKRMAYPKAMQAAIAADSTAAFQHIETIIEREGIACDWKRTGRFVGAWTRKHFEQQKARAAADQASGGQGLEAIPRERQREEIGSDLYHGGLVVRRSGALDPALYYKGLLDACLRRGVKVYANAAATGLAREGGGFRVTTAKGTILADKLLAATNGYTGTLFPALRRRIVPIASHVIATEPLDPAIAASLSPKGRTLSDSRRVLCYYRVSPDGTRMVFGGRARFTAVDPRMAGAVLHGFMLKRFPQLAGTRITHSWSGFTGFTFDALPHVGMKDGIHYALGCNGSGIALLSYLGAKAGEMLAGDPRPICGFDREAFPSHPLYTGNPWFLPAVGSAFRTLDEMERRRDG